MGEIAEMFQAVAQPDNFGFLRVNIDPAVGQLVEQPGDFGPQFVAGLDGI